MGWLARVYVTPKVGVLDPQGKAVAEALHALGFGAVREARVGRHLILDVDAPDAGTAESSVRGMCDKLLANPVTEDYEIAGVNAS